jgi:hypothetical protein
MRIKSFHDAESLITKIFLDLNQQFLILRNKYGTLRQDSDNHWYKTGNCRTDDLFFWE